jgi:23S rRNA pseudouridine1911/1915/1917 synthase
VVKASHKVKAGEEVSLEEPDLRPSGIVPEEIALEILYEDEYLLVLNKSRGMVVHPGSGVGSGTLVNALMAHCTDLSGIGGELRPGIVHRLDLYPSGVIVVAKCDKIHESLSKQFAARKVKKGYLAIAHGQLTPREGEVDAPLARHPVDRKRIAVRVGGRNSVTRYRVLEYFEEYSFIRLMPLTGRTHQIRVHMAHLGHPLVGDEVYTKKRNPFAIKGQALHSASLMFTHPATGLEMKFEAPLPEDMENILKALRSNAGL